MIGSPNYFIGVYDADESSYDARRCAVPDGSIAIEDVFESFYTLVGEPYDDTEFSGRSDYQAFIDNDIPSSGLFTGAEVLKTAEQAAIWGGTAGAQFDPCYHQACDTFANNADHALDVNADAVAFAVLTFAYSTESVNGVPGKRVPGSRAAHAGRARGDVPGRPDGGVATRRRRHVRSGRLVAPDRPLVAVAVGDRAAASPVVLVDHRPHDRRARRDGPVEHGVGLIADQVHRRLPGVVHPAVGTLASRT